MLTLFCSQRLAQKHTDTLFVKADVANMPFLVNKLSVKVLPCVIGFVEGVSKMKFVPALTAPKYEKTRLMKTSDEQIGWVR